MRDGSHFADLTIIDSIMVIIAEGLNLSKVRAGTYTLACLPLKLVGIDGSPDRAILIEENKA